MQSRLAVLLPAVQNQNQTQPGLGGRRGQGEAFLYIWSGGKKKHLDFFAR